MSSSLFWYARRRNSPLLARESEKELGVNARFDSRLPQYQCPLCHGFDNHVDPAGPFKKILDFGDFAQALQHILSAHPRVPMSRRLQFLYEETLECPTICDAWKVILQEKYDDGIASLAKGEIHQAIADLCGYTTSVDRMPTAVSNGSSIYESEKYAEADVTKAMGCAEARKFSEAGPSCHLKSLE
ncbi:hypothetical protein GGS24DRAFT_495004 [Hypoxylon argillaceum]|nr:hypothetical protein GGS24DRAFT_495004 [Hypoxylon argillaceum]